MKKIISAILAILYLGTSTGATVSMHYCMGELVEWGIGHNTSKSCNKCGMEKSDEKDNGCCKDEHKFIKNATDQKTVESSVINPLHQVIDLPVCSFSVSDISVSSVTEKYPVNNAPPRSSCIAVYIRNRAFLI